MADLEEIRITRGKDRGALYHVIQTKIINYGPQLGDVFAELILKKPKGEVVFAADQIYLGHQQPKTGFAFIDQMRPLPAYDYVLRPDRELRQSCSRKTQEKSPCCNRTLRYVGGGIHRQRAYCRKCDKEIQ
jgi:hypothetical protein